MPSSLAAVLLVAARLLPLAVLVPRAFGAVAPRKWSVGLGVVLVCAVAPATVPGASLPVLQGWPLVLAMIRESVLGVALSLGFAVLLAGLYLAGTILGQMSGLNIPDLAGPAAGAMGDTVVQRCFGWLALTVLLVSGGHRQLIEVLFDSFVAVPLGSPPPHVAAAPLAGQLLAHCFQSGLRVAAPVAFCLIVSTALVAVLARTMPALGAFGVSVALNLLILLLVTCVSLEAMATVYQDAWSTGVDQLLVKVLRPEGLDHE